MIAHIYGIVKGIFERKKSAILSKSLSVTDNLIVKITVYYTASVLCSSSTLSAADFSPLPARVLENSMHIVTKSASTPEAINMAEVFAYATMTLNRNEAIGIDAVLNAVVIPSVLARKS